VASAASLDVRVTSISRVFASGRNAFSNSINCSVVNVLKLGPSSSSRFAAQFGPPLLSNQNLIIPASARRQSFSGPPVANKNAMSATACTFFA
jgi:hypothetical protein